VLGLVENSGSNTYGVLGRLQTSTGTLVTFGVLGFRSGTTNYGVFSGGDFGGSGAKFFVEPHPTDPTKVIRYVALEGPQPQTFFNGRGRFQGGVAQISVPEDFRLVTDAEGLVVQVTPIGEMASIAVLKADLDSIVVKSSRNVEFFYTVNGIRRTMKDLVPIMNGTEFMPESPSARMPDSLAPAQKQMLISNGTYNADGSANLETAERVGWTKIWQEREAAAKAAAAANAKATQQRLADQAAAATKN
jgi:hypothetical protein